jgi:hypothetical protein
MTTNSDKIPRIVYAIYGIRDGQIHLYIGSCKQTLKERLSKHQTDFRSWFYNNDLSRYSSSCDLYCKFGPDNVKIMLLMKCDSVTKPEIEDWEGIWQIEFHRLISLHEKNWILVNQRFAGHKWYLTDYGAAYAKANYAKGYFWNAKYRKTKKGKEAMARDNQKRKQKRLSDKFLGS